MNYAALFLLNLLSDTWSLGSLSSSACPGGTVIIIVNSSVTLTVCQTLSDTYYFG